MGTSRLMPSFDSLIYAIIHDTTKVTHMIQVLSVNGLHYKEDSRLFPRVCVNLWVNEDNNMNKCGFYY